MEARLVKALLGVGIPLLALHFLEQLIFGFTDTFGALQGWYGVYAGWFRNSDTAAVTLIFSLSLLTLIAVWCSMQGGKWVAIPGIVFGLTFVGGISHFLEAVRAKAYAPGAVTGLIFAGLGIALLKTSIKLLVSKETEHHGETTP